MSRVNTRPLPASGDEAVGAADLPSPRRPGGEQPAEYFERRWQTFAEQIAQTFRWAFVAVLGLLNNLGFIAPPHTRVLVNILIGIWAVISVLVTVVLLMRYRPGRSFALGLTVVDLLLGAAIVYYSNGYGSPLFLALFLTVVTASVRLGLWMGLLSSVVVSLLYLVLGGLPGSSALDASQLRLDAFGRSAVLIVVGLVTGLMTRELLVQRRQAVRLAAEADTLRQLASELASSVGRKDLMDAVLGRAVNLTRAAEATMLLVEDGRLRLLASQGPGAAGSTGYDYDLARRALAEGKPVLDTAGTTLMTPVGTEEISALLQLRSEGRFEPRDLLVAGALAATVGGPLENAMRLQEKVRELEEVRERAETLAAQDRSRSDLLSMVSHELRRPLAVLNVYGRLLGERPALAHGPAAKLTETIASTLGEMDAMIEQLATAARLESGGPAPQTVTVDLGSAVEEAVSRVKPLAEAAHPIAVESPAQPVLARADPQYLRLILGNLLTNAIKFSPEGGEITCRVHRTQGRAAVSVTDRGIGIAPRDHARLFKRYSRLDDAAKRGIQGTGLGLYLSRELARAQGGDVRVHSKAGEGSTFSVTLPLAQ